MQWSKACLDAVIYTLFSIFIGNLMFIITYVLCKLTEKNPSTTNKENKESKTDEAKKVRFVLDH